MIKIDGGGFDIPAIFVTPQGRAPFPAVVLLHGTMSQKDEVGGLFARLAVQLAEAGIASLRIDFRGCGDSTEPQTDMTITTEVADGTAALNWLRARPDIGPLALAGFSQGGLIASLIAGTDPRVAALVQWGSGAINMMNSYFGDLREQASRDGHVTLDMPWRSFTFSREWFDTAAATDVEAVIAGYRGPLLCVACEGDDIVPSSASRALIAASSSTDATLKIFEGGDHIFGVLEPDQSKGDFLSKDQSIAEQTLALTTTWLSKRLSLT
ncbi:alpha/beta fold hydrolase [Nonomuraea sp. NPDC000554]|uniref:alpha/beta hydrolase family protein n=1 Tax=Nonomuraea sp. NPDC000554 TaxID=3154259 RepID=UPI003329EFB7